MLQRIFNAIGDWNPQLLREWQGRFKPWDVTGAFAVSAIAQFAFITERRTKLPYADARAHQYCTGLALPPSNDPMEGKGSYDPVCLKDQWGDMIINWQPWWQDNFVPLTQILLGAVIIAGVYWLISDFIFEERRGTLNFVRLSPRSGKEILWGKLLGVPTLVYVALAVAIPLHLYAAVQGQVPLSILIGVYVVGAASCLFFLSGALLWSVTTSVLGYLQPWAGAGFAALTVWALMNMPEPSAYTHAMNWLSSFDPSIMLRHLMKPTYPRQFLMSWFDISFNASHWRTMLFITVYLSVWTHWIWKALLRRFQNARGTVLSKKQSYAFTACLIGSVAGFSWGGYATDEVLTLCLIISLVVVTLITPNRQTLHEWARYRHQMPRKSLLSDLFWGEKSPALLAVAVNMAIATTILFPVSVMNSGRYLESIFELVAFAIVVLTLAAIFQAMLMLRMPRPEAWAVGSWIFCWIVPAIVTTSIGVPSNVTWVFSIAPWLAASDAPIATILLSLMTQLSVFGLLTNRLIQQLDRAGVSESKAFLT
jgi:hypothetical protein